MPLARFSLLILLGAGALVPSAQAQSTEIVFDVRQDEVPGSGPFWAPTNLTSSNTPSIVVDSQGHWYASAQGQDTGLWTVFDENGVILAGDAPGQSVKALRVEDNGDVVILRESQLIGTQVANTLFRYDGASLVPVLENGADLSAVAGLPAGATLASILNGEVHGTVAASIVGYVLLPNGEFFGLAFLQLQLDTQGNVVGGSLVGSEDTPPPVGTGTVAFIRQITGNALGDNMWGALIQPQSRRRVYRNGALEFSYQQVLGGLTLGQVPAASTLDYGPTGDWLAVLAAVAPTGDAGGIIVRTGQIFAKGGAPLAGFGDVRRIMWDNARFLNGGFVSWVHEDTTLPLHANESYVVESTRAFREADVRFEDRYSTDLLRNPFSTSPSGRYLAAYALLQPGAALVVVDTLGTPSAPCSQGPDALFPNQDCLSAFDLGLVNTEFEALELNVETGVPDFVRMTIPPESEVVVETTSDFEAADLDLVLWSADCVQPTELLTNTVFSDNPGLVWPNPTTQPLEVVLELRVAPSSTYPCSVYDLRIESRPTPICPPGVVEDPYEPKNLPDMPFALLPGSYSGLYIQDMDDKDHFQVRVEPLGSVRILANHPATLAGPSFLRGRLSVFPFSSIAIGTTFDDQPVELLWENDDPVYWSGSTPEAVDVLIEIEWNRAGTTLECTYYELEIESDPGPGWASYCGPANANSRGLAARMVPQGSSSLGAFDLVLAAEDMPLNQFGYFLVSPDPGFVALVGGSSGNLCLGGGIGRYNGFPLFTGTTGGFDLQPNPSQTPTPTGTVAIQAGQTWHYQAWYRDSDGAPTSNFTDATAITFLN